MGMNSVTPWTMRRMIAFSASDMRLPSTLSFPSREAAQTLLEVRGGVVLGIPDDDELDVQVAHRPSLRERDGVVRALRVDVRSQQGDEVVRGVLLEGAHRVHA